MSIATGSVVRLCSQACSPGIQAPVNSDHEAFKRGNFNDSMVTRFHVGHNGQYRLMGNQSFRLSTSTFASDLECPNTLVYRFQAREPGLSWNCRFWCGVIFEGFS